jgi:antitoxin component HigA of HigAB toxin-antitoxin module
MKKLDLNTALKVTELSSELELVQATALQNKLRWMIKDNPALLPVRKHLRSLILKYETAHWQNDNLVSEKQIVEHNKAEEVSSFETKFIRKRSELIKRTLKKYDLNQQNLADMLGHSKTYMSELINGVRPFAMNDLLILHKYFKIKLELLIPPFIKKEKIAHANEVVKELHKPKLRALKSGSKFEFAYA